jgi:hypothetical protein
MNPAQSGQRYVLGLRVGGEIKQWIDEEAKRSGRTQSQTAEAFLEDRRNRQQLLPEVLELTYGRALAGLLMALGRAMKEAGQHTALFAGDGPVAMIYGWMREQHSYDQATIAARAVLDGMRPSEPSNGAERLKQKFSDYPKRVQTLMENIGRDIGADIVEALHNPDRGEELGQWAAPVRAMIGHTPNPALAVRSDNTALRTSSDTKGKSK